MPIQIAVPRLLLPLWRQLFNESTKTLKNLGDWKPRSDVMYRDYIDGSGTVVNPRQMEWNRLRVPILRPLRNDIEHDWISVPSGRLFRYNNEDKLPRISPTLSVRQTSHRFKQYPSNIRPTHLLYIRRNNARKRPEENRRRHDQKVPHGYRRLLSVINRTYGEYSEYAEVADAVTANRGDPGAILTALAGNQAIDYLYGKRAQLLKRRIYSSKYYQLPVGIDFLKNRFGLF